MTIKTIKLIVNYLLFQLGWFACVLGGSEIALATTIMILAVHLLWVGSWAQEKQLLAVTFFLGCAIDSFLGNMDILQFHPDHDGRILPLWLACLWLIFATTLRHSLDWTRTHRLYGAALGMVGGPLSYYAGTQLSDVTLAPPLWQTLLLLAAIWAITIALLQSFSQAWLNKTGKQ